MIPENAQQRMDDSLRDDTPGADEEDLSREEKSILWRPSRGKR